MQSEYNFRYPATFLKAGKINGNRIPITIIPSLPTKDRQNDTITLTAFDAECKKSFLTDGLLDYDHLSYRGETPLIKAQAIIGKPLDLSIKDGIPCCDGYLFKSNPYVYGSILPALENDADIFGASVGGSVLKSSPNEPGNTKAGQTISQVRLKHIAICPLQNAVHQGTKVMLKKSDTGEEFSFDSFGQFVKSFSDEDIFMKAMTAGSATAIDDMSGGQVLQPQSLEGGIAKLVSNAKVKIALPYVLENLVSGKLKGNTNALVHSIKSKGLTEGEANRLVQLIAKNSVKIVNKIKNK